MSNYDIVACVTKEARSTPAGISFSRLDDGKVLISKIQRNGLFAGTDLKVGMEVVSINNIYCSGRPIDTVSSIVDDADGTIRIKAQEVPSPQTNEAEIHVAAASIPPEQSVPLVTAPQTKETKIHVPASESPTPLPQDMEEDTEVSTPGRKEDSPPPPGCSTGGVWGHIKYAGMKTKMLSCLACLFVCLPGLLMMMCPQDEEEAYLVNNKVYNEAGQCLGNLDDLQFTSLAESQR